MGQNWRGKSVSKVLNNDFTVVKLPSVQPSLFPLHNLNVYLFTGHFASSVLAVIFFAQKFQFDYIYLSDNSFIHAHVGASSDTHHWFQFLVWQSLLICDINLIRRKGEEGVDRQGGISSITIPHLRKLQFSKGGTRTIFSEIFCKTP